MPITYGAGINDTSGLYMYLTGQLFHDLLCDCPKTTDFNTACGQPPQNGRQRLEKMKEE